MTVETLSTQEKIMFLYLDCELVGLLYRNTTEESLSTIATKTITRINDKLETLYQQLGLTHSEYGIWMDSVDARMLSLLKDISREEKQRMAEKIIGE